MVTPSPDNNGAPNDWRVKFQRPAGGGGFVVRLLRPTEQPNTASDAASDADAGRARPALSVVRDTPPEGSDEPGGPFATTWRDYHAAGYPPIYLPAGKKFPVPTHEGDVWYTGGRSQPATVEKLIEWQSHPRNRLANIGISFCNTVTVGGVEHQLVGIDVDHYDEKRGGDQLAALVARLGPMSDQEAWTSSSRTDGVSGIRWHLAPLEDDDGKRISFGSKADSAIDVVWRGHKHAVVWPSLHPEGGRYWWFPPGVTPDEAGRDQWNTAKGLPVLTEFPVLSPSWVAYLTSDRRNDTSGLKLDWDTSNVDLLKWAEDSFNDGNADKTCWNIASAVTTWKRNIDGDPSSHDKITDSLWMLYRLAAEGHTGWKDAVEDIETYWRTGVLDAGKRSNSEADGEIWRSKLGALRKCKAMVDAGQPVAAECDCAGVGANLWHSDRVPLGVAKQFALINEREYTPIRRWRGDWYQYGGGCWKRLEDDDFHKRLYDCLETATYLNKDGAPIPWNPTERKIASVAHALRSVVLVDAGTDAPHWLDGRNERVIAFQNTLLRVSDRKQIDCTPAYFNTNVLPFDYDPVPPEARRWQQFLAELWPDDPESIAALQEWFGYVVSGRTDLHKMMAIFGPPRTGKGTIVAVLESLIGAANHSGTSADDLSGNFGLEPLIGKSLAVIDEMAVSGSGKKFVAVLKNISGEGRPSVNRKNRTAWNGRLAVRFMLIANERTNLPDASGAIIDRMVVLNTAVSFASRPDIELRNALETELPGIFNWALDGLDRLTAQGRFTVPSSTRGFVGEMHSASSPVTDFIEEKCAFNPEGYVSRTRLYRMWREWCEQNGLSSGSINSLLAKIRAAFGSRIECNNSTKRGPRGNQERVFLGIELRPEVERVERANDLGCTPAEAQRWQERSAARSKGAER
jgi:P4 family phage/plasmid primase-like protien